MNLDLVLCGIACGLIGFCYYCGRGPAPCEAGSQQWRGHRTAATLPGAAPYVFDAMQACTLALLFADGQAEAARIRALRGFGAPLDDSRIGYDVGDRVRSAMAEGMLDRLKLPNHSDLLCDNGSLLHSSTAPSRT